METFEKIAFLVLAWLFGLLGPVIVDAIKRHRENKLGRKAIKVELANLKIRLAFVCYSFEERQGTLTKQRLQWLINLLNSVSEDEEASSVKTTLTKLLELPDDQLDLYFVNKKSPNGKSLTLQKYGTPLLDARVSALWTFDTDAQRTLLEIRSALDIISEIVDRARFFTNLTFQKLENGNYGLAVENAEGCYEQYAQQAKRIILLIEKFETPQNLCLVK